ncbi:MAG TPA: plastocyanin [Chromatiaceae bacterium]|nr:plastocyanin [Chromatiaceae bacterium]
MLLLSLNAPFASLAEERVHEVKIFKFKFIPAEITINAGDKVRWINKEKRQYHSVWFEALGEPEPDYIFPDESYERVFNDAGDFPYRCGPHPEMRGMVRVR